jgi:hypothetical protein
MSRHHTTGTNPDTNEPVDIFYGYDQVPGFVGGYFFQVYSRDEEDKLNDPSGEGIIVNEGFLNGISKRELNNFAEQWQCGLKTNI